VTACDKLFHICESVVWKDRSPTVARRTVDTTRELFQEEITERRPAWSATAENGPRYDVAGLWNGWLWTPVKEKVFPEPHGPIRRRWSIHFYTMVPYRKIYVSLLTYFAYWMYFEWCIDWTSLNVIFVIIMIVSQYTYTLGLRSEWTKQGVVCQRIDSRYKLYTGYTDKSCIIQSCSLRVNVLQRVNDNTSLSWHFTSLILPPNISPLDPPRTMIGFVKCHVTIFVSDRICCK